MQNFVSSWLLTDDTMQVRTSYEGYQTRSDIYINEVVSRVKHQQFYTESGTAMGGPIIMTQIENEYGAFGYEDFPRDEEHLRLIKAALIEAGIETILFTSDSQLIYQDWGSVDGEFMTTNFKYNGTENMDTLLSYQPDRPIIVTEYWPGWFDHWYEPYHDILSVDGKF